MNPMTDERRRKNIAYWRSIAPAYPFHAQSPTLDPSPTDVVHATCDGWFVAVPMGDEITYWGFETADGRDVFLKTYPQATELAAEAVFGNPV